MAAWGRAIGSSQKIFIYRKKEASKPLKAPHNRPSERNQPQRQNQTPKSKKPFKNVARDTTPSINLQRKYASQRESYIYTCAERDDPPDTPLSGSLLRLLCHHAHMLANLSVSREGELPQITVYGFSKFSYIYM